MFYATSADVLTIVAFSPMSHIFAKGEDLSSPTIHIHIGIMVAYTYSLPSIHIDVGIIVAYNRTSS